MGNITSKPSPGARERIRDSTSSRAPLKVETQDPARMSFPRSPGTANLANYDPGRTQSTINEVVVSSFAGEEAAPNSGDPAISHPVPARPMIRRYSELIDPTRLEESHVRSPSGHLLSGSSYALRDDRPLSVRERQERIRQQVMLQRQQSENHDHSTEQVNRYSMDASSHGKKEKRSGCLSCLGS